jgi:hypothetical protein
MVELEATEWRQYNNVVPRGVDSATATVAGVFGCPVTAYASVIEEATGDPTTITFEPQIEISADPYRRGPIFTVPWADQPSAGTAAAARHGR